MQWARGEFEGAALRLGDWTERTLSPRMAIALWEPLAEEDKFVGTAMCLGRAGRPVGLMRCAISMGSWAPPCQRPSGGSMRGTLISPSPSKRMRRGFRSVTRRGTAPLPRPLQSVSPHFGDALLRGNWMLGGPTLQWERIGGAPWRKPLILQVMPSPKRVSATRGRNQWGQKKS